MYQSGRLQSKQRVVSEYPDVDMSRLSAEQKAYIENEIKEIKGL